MNIDIAHEQFPGIEFCKKAGSEEHPEYLYDLSHLRYGSTTSGQQIVIPDIEHRVMLQMQGNEQDVKFYDSSAPKIHEKYLTSGQLKAFDRARKIQALKERQQPIVNTLPSLRKLTVDESGLLYLCQSYEGPRLHPNKPSVAVEEITMLGECDFATYAHGYYGLFIYDETDLTSFIPEQYANRANAFAIIDQPRVIVGPNSDHNYHIARIMYYETTVDTSENTEPAISLAQLATAASFTKS